MFYTIYKITNKINNKFYIGKHQTKDLNDNYMGSGKLIKAAIKKYGVDNFTKEILFIFNSEQDMNAKEKELVIINEQSYNLCAGGKGGFGFINSNNLRVQRYFTREDQIKGNKYLIDNNVAKKTHSEGKLKHTYFGNRKDDDSIKEKLLSPEVKAKRISSFKKINHQQGKNNSQHGTCWITNGVENKKIKREDINIYISLGFYKGRI